MGLIDVLEKALPIVEVVASKFPIAAEALQVTKQIAGTSSRDWDRRKDKARVDLTGYFDKHSARIEDTLDALKQGSRERTLLDRLAPGFADEATREVAQLAREQGQTRRQPDDHRGRSDTRYTIYPVSRG